MFRYTAPGHCGEIYYIYIYIIVLYIYIYIIVYTAPGHDVADKEGVGELAREDEGRDARLAVDHRHRAGTGLRGPAPLASDSHPSRSNPSHTRVDRVRVNSGSIESESYPRRAHPSHIRVDRIRVISESIASESYPSRSHPSHSRADSIRVVSTVNCAHNPSQLSDALRGGCRAIH